MRKLYQMHMKHKDHRSEFVAQRSIGSQKALMAFTWDVIRDHDLAPGTVWLLVPEDSDRFLWAVDTEEGR